MMGWPQITLIVLMAITGGIMLSKDGEARRYSFWSWALDASITIGLLYAGGFFK